jgi:hypothetical protein
LDWIAKRIQEAQQVAPTGEAVATLLQQQLAATMRERAWARSEYADFANELIAAIQPLNAKGAA